MIRKIVIIPSALGLLAAAYATGYFFAAHAADRTEEQLVAVSWGGGRYGPAFYGAYVFVIPTGEGYSVRAVVKIGPEGGLIHDCGELGRSRTREEAVSRWGHVEWRDDGLHVGDYFLSRTIVESHR